MFLANNEIFYRLIHQMNLMLEATRGQEAPGGGIQPGWVVREGHTDWMLDMMFTNCLMLRKRQYQMKYKYSMHRLLIIVYVHCRLRKLQGK